MNARGSKVLTVRHRVAVGAALLIGALAVAGCGSSGSNGARSVPTSSSARSATSSPSPSAHATITIHAYAFGAPITVAPGTRVTVKNADPTTHTLAADNGMFDTGNIFMGKSATFVAPTTPGTYKFHCNIHAEMHGDLIVAP